MRFLRCYNSYIRDGGGVPRSRGENVTKCKKWNLNPVVVFLVVSCYMGFVESALSLSKLCGEKECQGLEYCSQIDHTCKPCSTVCDRESHNFDENRCVNDCQDYIHDERYLTLQNSTLLELEHMKMEEKYKQLQSDVFILKIIVCVCVIVILLVVAVLTAFLVYFWKLLHPPEPASPEEKKQIKGSTKVASTPTTVELPTVYNNRYGVTTPTPETSPSSVMSTSPADTNITTFTSIVPPSYRGGRTISDVSATARTSPETVTTTLTSTASTLVGKEFSKMNGGSPTKPATAAPTPINRFRREPSESTLPDNCAYDNLSMSPQHHIHYSHHV